MSKRITITITDQMDRLLRDTHKVIVGDDPMATTIAVVARDALSRGLSEIRRKRSLPKEPTT